MNVLFVLLGMVSGTALAFILNKLLADKIANRMHRIGLKVTAYSVCIILGMAFAAIGSLRIILNTFMENRIAFIEAKLAESFPNTNILEMSIDTGAFASTVDELQEAIAAINTSGDGFFERLVFDGFVHTLTGYINAVENGMNTVLMPDGTNGVLTIPSILYNLKNMALDIVSPYFVFGRVGILIVLLIYIGVYTGIVIFLKKGGAEYNKSLVFGDITYDDQKPSQNKE